MASGSIHLISVTVTVTCCKAINIKACLFSSVIKIWDPQPTSRLAAASSSRAVVPSVDVDVWWSHLASLIGTECGVNYFTEEKMTSIKLTIKI
jgi:hypothetical protein